MKKLRVLFIFIFIIFLLLNCTTNTLRKETGKKTYEWNGGHCSIDGGRLDYEKTGDKVFYRCEICGKEYLFEGVQKYE